MKAGYIIETNFYSELESAKAIIVFNYVFHNRPCEIINHVTNFLPDKNIHSNALGVWKVKLKLKKK